jgi:hypothetical protein
MKRFIKLITILSLIFVPTVAFAAEVSLERAFDPFFEESIYEIQVVLDPEGSEWTAVQGEILFESDSVRLLDLKTGGSLVGLWVDTPEIKGNRVRFSGMTPGGGGQEKGLLFSIFLQVAELQESEILTIELSDFVLSVYPDFSEPVEIKMSPLSLLLVSTSQPPQNVQITDKTQPNGFSLSRIRSKLISSRHPVLLFQTVDDNAGISHYELFSSTREQEITEDFLESDGWVHVESPLILDKGLNDTYLYIKAVDRAGNVLTRSLDPESEEPEVKRRAQLITLAVLFFLSLVILLYEHYFMRRSFVE